MKYNCEECHLVHTPSTVWLATLTSEALWAWKVNEGWQQIMSSSIRSHLNATTVYRNIASVTDEWSISNKLHSAHCASLTQALIAQYIQERLHNRTATLCPALSSTGNVHNTQTTWSSHNSKNFGLVMLMVPHHLCKIFFTYPFTPPSTNIFFNYCLTSKCTLGCQIHSFSLNLWPSQLTLTHRTQVWKILYRYRIKNDSVLPGVTLVPISRVAPKYIAWQAGHTSLAYQTLLGHITC